MDRMASTSSTHRMIATGGSGLRSSRKPASRWHASKSHTDVLLQDIVIFGHEALIDGKDWKR